MECYEIFLLHIFGCLCSFQLPNLIYNNPQSLVYGSTWVCRPWREFNRDQLVLPSRFTGEMRETGKAESLTRNHAGRKCLARPSILPLLLSTHTYTNTFTLKCALSDVQERRDRVYLVSLRTSSQLRTICLASALSVPIWH